MGPKNQILKQGNRAYLFNPFDSSRVFVCQNWMKNGQVMTMGSGIPVTEP